MNRQVHLQFPLLLILIGIAATGAWQAAEEPESPARDAVDRAEAALLEDESEPYRWRLVVLSRMARDAAGDRLAAVEIAERARQRFADDPEMVSLHARALLHLGEYAHAKQQARWAIALADHNPEGHLVLGEILMGEWDLDDARQELERAAGLKPDDPEPLFLLSQLYEREKHYPLAADTWELYNRLLKGETSPLRRMGKDDEGRAGVLRAMRARTPFAIDGEAFSTTVPMRRAKTGIYLVRVRPNGGPWEWFDVDTGSEGVIISRSLLRKLDLKEVSRTAVTGIGGRVVSSSAAIMPSLEIGEFTVRNIPVEVIDRFPKHRGKPVTGSIGQSLLREFIVTMNYPAGTFTLELPRRQLFAEKTPEGPAVRSMKHAIPMRYPSITRGNWGDAGEFPVLWDTGAGLSVIDAGLLGTVPDPPEMEGQERRGKDGTGEIIAYRKMAEPSAIGVENLSFIVQPAILDLKLINRKVPYLGGIIGVDVMEDYVVTFDYFRGELRLQKLGAALDPDRTGGKRKKKDR